MVKPRNPRRDDAREAQSPAAPAPGPALQAACLPLLSLAIRPPPPKNMSNMSMGDEKLGLPEPPSLMACSPP